ncbi:MAG: S8 family serine peptidase [Longimicrobiales bacterium]
MRVAVIDSGVVGGHSHVGDVEAGIRIRVDGEDDDTIDQIGHGTAVAAAILEKAPCARIVPVRVFDRHLATTAHTLAHAIRWAVEHDCRLINLSLGTANPEHEALLAEAVTYARLHGSLIVSPGEQNGVHWLPGSLEGAMPVQLDWMCPRDRIRVVAMVPDAATRESASAGDLLIHASGYPRPIPGIPPERNLHGVSFAVANVTGFLALLLEARPDVRTGKDVLRSLDVAAR